MRSVVISGAMIALAVLTGCSGWNTFDKGPVVVDYHVGTTELSGYPKMTEGTSDSFYEQAGSQRRDTFGPYNVRQCNTQRTACSLGLVTLNSELKILSVGDATTKLQITVDYKVSPEWRRDVAGGVFTAKLPNSEIIHGQGTVSRTAEITYGEVRHVELPYGLSYTLCASAPGVTTKSTRHCANQLNVKDPSSVPAI
ncbi:hypothetical protein M2426_001251 [Pseudomonas moraviensis]|uniref:hypothetical protein n=1 Tax=Pseudomonas moraviensis TaxID=321662 RepID=UPI003D1DA92B